MLLSFLCFSFLLYFRSISDPNPIISDQMLNENTYLKATCSVFSQLIVMNKCFLLNPENIFWRKSVLVFREKRKNRLTPTHFNSAKMTSIIGKSRNN